MQCVARLAVGIRGCHLYTLAACIVFDFVHAYAVETARGVEHVPGTFCSLHRLVHGILSSLLLLLSSLLCCFLSLVNTGLLCVAIALHY